MSKIAIKGHPTRGNEVIKLLEMMGGQCVSYSGFVENYYYSIDKYDNIFGMPNLPNDIKYTILTLEEFLEKYPYKVGDKVRVPEYESEVCISSMYWNGSEVQYEVVTDEVEWYSAEELNKFNEPYKEETMKEKENSVVVNIEHKQLKVNSLRFDKTQLVINDEYELKQEMGEYYIVRKKPTYPKTYNECCEVLKIPNDERYIDIDIPYVSNYNKLLSALAQLLICRNAYWKVAGEQMGLCKPWEPDWNGEVNTYYTIHYNGTDIKLYNYTDIYSKLAFPTEEMRDAFYENFKELIEQCKELL